MDKIKSWPWFICGLICAVVVIYLIATLLSTGGFFAWCWKLPCTIFAAMAAVVFCDVGVNGDRPPR